MKIKEIILEYNLQNLLSLFQEKYKEKKQKDPSNTHDTLDQFIKSIEDPLRKENKFQFIDPYMKWIVQRYVTGKLNRYEDVMSKVIPGLLKYDSLKRKNKLKPEHKDINGIKDINELLDVLDQYKEEDTKSDKEKEKEIEENFYRNGEAELIHNDSDLKIVVPKSERASCFFGRNTRWCTAATKGENYFDYYNSQGNLYIIILKKENRRFQFHFESEQFMNERDVEIKIYDFIKKYPKIFDIFNKIVKEKNIETPYFKKPDEVNEKNLKKLIEKNDIFYIYDIISKNRNLITDDFLIEYLKNIKVPSNIQEILALKKFNDRDIINLLEKSDIDVFSKFFKYTDKKYYHLLKNKNIYEKLNIIDIFDFINSNDIEILDYIDFDIIEEKLKKANNKEIVIFFNDFLREIYHFIKFEKGKKLIYYVFYFILKRIDNNSFDFVSINQGLFLESLKVLKEDNSIKKIVDFIFIKKPEIFEKFHDYNLRYYRNLIVKGFIEYKNVLKNKDTIISFFLGNLPKKTIKNLDVHTFLSILQENYYINKITTKEEIINLLKEYIKEDYHEFFDILLSFHFNFLHISNLLFDEDFVFDFVKYLNNDKTLNAISSTNIEKFIRYLKNKNSNLYNILLKDMDNIKIKYPKFFN